MEEFNINSVQVILWKTMENLIEDDFKKFKNHLKVMKDVPLSKLEKADRDDTVELIVQTYTEEFAGKTVVNILKQMNLNQMANDLQEKVLKIELQPMLEKQKAFEDARRAYEQREEQIKTQAKYAEKQINKGYKKFDQALQDEVAAKIAALREEEEQKSQMMKEKIEKMNREISALSDTMRAIEEKMRSDDVTPPQF
ncbi:caspase b-like [Sardina pilchardus]|uniref:caspase b-like n=1 Tax=Sardina pilchardus TaxID=27697 RepID=UPI002E141C29